MRSRRSAAHWGAFTAHEAEGRLVSISPFEHDPHPTALNSIWPEMLTSPMRVARPVVRKGWLADDGGAARGEDDYVAIPWDEALDMAAEEIGRVRREHGNSALFAGSYGWSSAGRIHHARTLIRRFYNSLGGFTDQVTNYSYGAAMAFLPRVVGVHNAVGSSLTAFNTIRDHCDVMLALGGIPAKNWEVNSGGFGQHRYEPFLHGIARSTRVVNVSPYKGDIEDRFPAEWLPIRPNTDTALLLAVMHVLVSDNAHDRDFLARYCQGAEVLIAYLTGKTDGVAKSPAWASTITGIDIDAIVALARSLVGKRVLVTANWSLQRARHGEQPYWAIIALSAMLGQIGLPGGGFAFGYGSSNGMGNPRYDTPLYGLPTGQNAAGYSIPCARVADLLLNPGRSFRFDGKVGIYPEIRLIHWAGGNPFHHHQDLNRLREGFRRPDTVIVNECYWTATARHADIVFPATTALERNDIGGASRDPYILAMQQVVPPVGQARNDYDIFAELATRLGCADTFTEGRTTDEWVRFAWDQISARLARRGLEPPSFERFWEDGYFEMPDPKDNYVMFADFREDPEQHRLPTPSGRIELYSEDVATMTEGRIPGHPAWLDPEEWLGADLAATYPIHLLTPQPARRLHGQMDWSAYSRAGKVREREVLQLNPEDAAARGIAEGDPVRLFNDRGACFAVARLTVGLVRGVALLPTGATYDPDGASDRNSNPNVLTRDIGTSELGQGSSAQSCLVEIEKFSGELPELRVNRPPVQHERGEDEIGVGRKGRAA
ncbi:molybdopterin-dependent oxidoreductase [Mesorhizobium sp. J428]|uniref:molybdopterin-dependent oxidoreductase n=1 Tax=Mesorhizobium sp. J428 TaxID=2898440 RepID=UPI0021518840|nr:molybdopterin-dependent oxidoreductase [Mesorhizobium sp. J428]MCR5856437.1 molybdopterin-dependent oxidoreductase [Mesorhizobium sp. J428]